MWAHVLSDDKCNCLKQDSPNVISALTIPAATQQGVVNWAAPATVLIGLDRSSVYVTRTEWIQIKI